jgi:putative heme iron utilization protein
VQRRQFVHPGGRQERIDGLDAPVVAAVLVWTSLQAWDDATVVLLKGQNVVEVRGRIPPGRHPRGASFTT